jgi:hypothetical protein
MTVRLIEGKSIWPPTPLHLLVFRAISRTIDEPVVLWPEGIDYAGHSIQPGQQALIPREWIADTYEVRQLGRIASGIPHRLYVLKQKPELVFIAPESFDTMVPPPEHLAQTPGAV